MKKLVIWISVILLVLVGCTDNKIEDNKIYSIEESEGQDQQEEQEPLKGTPENVEIQNKLKEKEPFPNGEAFNKVLFDLQLSSINPYPRIDTDIPITLSPDGKTLYYMEPYQEEEGRQFVIKGQPIKRMNLVKINVETKERKVIKEDIPFITLAKWNKDGDIVAFQGKTRLIVYNHKDKRLYFENRSDQELVSYFGWSPDGRKLYTEHPNLVNSSIYYMDTREVLEPYSNKEALYYKGTLDENYYYGTIRSSDTTALIDGNGNIIEQFDRGRFREAYKDTMLQIGIANFGLNYYYHPNINEQRRIGVRSEYIYDAKFIYDGNIAYITEEKGIEDNQFILHFADNEGNIIKELQVQGGNLLVLPDGKKGYIAGPYWQEIDLVNHTITKTEKHTTSEDKDQENIVKTIRGAVDTYFRHELVNVRDYEAVDKYFIDTHNPEQWAKFDILTRFEEYGSLEPNGYAYNTEIYVKKLEINKEKGTATVEINVLGRNSYGTGLGMNFSLEMIKQNNTWYVTGLSTFVNSEDYQDIKVVVEEAVKELKSGTLDNFGNHFQNKEIEIGQIQFWKMSEPHLALSIDEANYLKVYLKVQEEGEEVIYKMILDYRLQPYWKVKSIGNYPLSGLL